MTDKKLKKIIELIDKDIEYQKKQIKGDFEEDRPLHWRIMGLEYIKDEIKEIMGEKEC